MAGRRGPRTAAVAGIALAGLFACASTALATPSPGSAGLGDPYFPKAGNGGYEVDHYRLGLRYHPASRRLIARARIDATATQNLSRFDLDFRGMHVLYLAVDGNEATIERHGQELVVTPPAAIRDGDAFRVYVHYGGKPRTITDPDNSEEGWLHTDDGAVALGEPQGSPAWYPCNDHPTDKATYRVRIAVPHGFKAISNGALVKRHRTEDTSAFVWSQNEPMATYLSTVAIGHFDLQRYDAGPIPSWVATDPRTEKPAVLEGQTEQTIPFLAKRYDAYPFSTTGGIVDNDPSVGYALETQTRPFYPHSPSDSLVVHELAHQWFGDSVSLSRWKDIWLNEGFAEWSEWLWAEKHGGPSAQHKFDGEYATPGSDSSFWNPPPGDPGGPGHLFDDTVYVRGAMTLQALRDRVGNSTFFQILRDWVAQNRYGNVTTQDFIDLAESDSGQDLGQFFQTWLYDAGKPQNW